MIRLQVILDIVIDKILSKSMGIFVRYP